MLQKLKRWGIYGAVGLSICGSMFLGGYIVRSKQTAVINVQTNGSILERTNIVYQPFTVDSDSDCSDIKRLYNGLLIDYKYFLSASPEVYEVTSENIKFKLATQKYKLSYSYSPKNKWSINPFALARATFNPLGLYYGGGCSVEYIGITGILAFDSQPSLTIGAGYRFVFDMK